MRVRCPNVVGSRWGLEVVLVRGGVRGRVRAIRRRRRRETGLRDRRTRLRVIDDFYELVILIHGKRRLSSRTYAQEQTVTEGVAALVYCYVTARRLGPFFAIPNAGSWLRCFLLRVGVRVLYQ